MPPLRMKNERDLAAAGLRLSDDGKTLVPIKPPPQAEAPPPMEAAAENDLLNDDRVPRIGPDDDPDFGMSDEELLAYCTRQDEICRDLSCRSVRPFWRRGFALTILFERHPGRWTRLCQEKGIGRTWATHARAFHALFPDPNTIPAGKTLTELLEEAGILSVHKLNKPDEDEADEEQGAADPAAADQPIVAVANPPVGVAHDLAPDPDDRKGGEADVPEAVDPNAGDADAAKVLFTVEGKIHVEAEQIIIAVPRIRTERLLGFDTTVLVVRQWDARLRQQAKEKVPILILPDLIAQHEGGGA